ncbi:ABC-three component system middle component 5 [Ferrimonas sp. YFM]|uniref:ABC-three component system middle component 5 n=1 Tax=Ferrimonas sp. YFM TaxID=3028878 RepID=UPI0025737A75|nr:ABC-three component system middle component 5 [Ferrimonas sp. YFM]
MIIYHPAHDVNHCSYRILNVLYAVKSNELHCDMLKIINFYYVYPHLLKDMESYPRPLNYQAKKIRNIRDSFELTPNPSSLFFEMNPTHETAISSLHQRSLISIERNIVSLERQKLPHSLIQEFKNDKLTKSDLFKILVECLPKVKLDGDNGLKAKSGLMEYKYD